MRIKVSVEDCFKRSTTLDLHTWNSVKDIKDRLQHALGVPATDQRLFLAGKELRNHRVIYDSNIQDGTKLYLAIQLGTQQGAREHHISIYGNCSCPEGMKDLITSARQGLAAGLAPNLAIDGTGGTYFLRSYYPRQRVLVFKPSDEEPFAPNNPRNTVGDLGQAGFRRGIRSGEGYLREVAAYLLDHGHFSGVPRTTVVEMRHPRFHNKERWSALDAGSNGSTLKVGSLQEYINYDDVAGDLAPKMFHYSEVHKIAILDFRLANSDRNDANLLVQRFRDGKRVSACCSPDWNDTEKSSPEEFRLIPIDHAYSLPDTLEVSWADWMWLEWPQAKVPFDAATREYVAKLDVEKDIKMLRDKLGIREACLRIMRITGALLKKGVAAGLTLRQIAGVICRDDMDVPSELEIMCNQAQKLAEAAHEQAKVKAPSPYVGPHLARRGQGEGDRRSASPTSGGKPRSSGVLRLLLCNDDFCLNRSASFTSFDTKKLDAPAAGFRTVSPTNTGGLEGRLAASRQRGGERGLAASRSRSVMRLSQNDHYDTDDEAMSLARGGAKKQSRPESSLFQGYLRKLLDQHIQKLLRGSRRATPYSATPDTASNPASNPASSPTSPATDGGIFFPSPPSTATEGAAAASAFPSPARRPAGGRPACGFAAATVANERAEEERHDTLRNPFAHVAAEENGCFSLKTIDHALSGCGRAAAPCLSSLRLSIKIPRRGDSGGGDSIYCSPMPSRSPSRAIRATERKAGSSSSGSMPWIPSWKRRQMRMAKSCPLAAPPPPLRLNSRGHLPRTPRGGAAAAASAAKDPRCEPSVVVASTPRTTDSKTATEALTPRLSSGTSSESSSPMEDVTERRFSSGEMFVKRVEGFAVSGWCPPRQKSINECAKEITQEITGGWRSSSPLRTPATGGEPPSSATSIK